MQLSDRSVKQLANTSRLCPRKPRALLYGLVTDRVAVEERRLRFILLCITAHFQEYQVSYLNDLVAQPLLIPSGSLQAYEDSPIKEKL